MVCSCLSYKSRVWSTAALSWLLSLNDQTQHLRLIFDYFIFQVKICCVLRRYELRLSFTQSEKCAVLKPAQVFMTSFKIAIKHSFSSASLHLESVSKKVTELRLTVQFKFHLQTAEAALLIVWRDNNRPVHTLDYRNDTMSHRTHLRSGYKSLPRLCLKVQLRG